MNTKTVRLRRLALVAAAALLAGAGACGGDSDDLPPPPPTSPRAATATPTLDPVHRKILDTYHASVDAMVRAQHAGDPDHPDLTRYFAEGTVAFLNVQAGIERHSARGTMYEGELKVVAATVTDLDLNAEPPTATVESCLDDTDYRLVNRDDGSPVPETQPGGRYTTVSKALYGPDERWYIVETIAHWDEAC